MRYSIIILFMVLVNGLYAQLEPASIKDTLLQEFIRFQNISKEIIEGSPARGFKAKTIKGQTLEWDPYTDKTAIFYFWEVYNKTSIQKIAYLMELEESLDSTQFQIIVFTDYEAIDVRPKLKRAGIEPQFPIIANSRNFAYEFVQRELVNFERTFIIDKKGIIRHAILPFLYRGLDQWKQELSDAL